ncbi:CBM_collapsed_G0017090.mRNA.1.CDS.1 [Saccharomyces cerevisiae]|nr:CBM_collapsed_G0017090.mRNA.1.CDS.1 [Saccharomyces cerevisiae]
MVLLEKETESTISQYFREYGMSYSFLDFGLTKLNIFSSGIDVWFLPRGSIPQYGLCKAVKRCSSSVSVGLARKYRIAGWLGKH